MSLTTVPRRSIPAADVQAPMVAIRAITKRFKLRAPQRGEQTMRALDRVSLDVNEGDLVSILGPSGCGKTTLLRIVAGLILPDEGEILVGQAPVRAPRRDVCMVFQHFGLLPWRTVLDNVAFPLELDLKPRREREEVARAYLELVGLGGFERHLPHELSGGMQQRVGIARAMARRPLVLLMDEPFAALDAQTRETLQDDFLKLGGQLGTTVIFVTHSIDEALVMSDRVMILSARPGRLRRIIEWPVADRAHRDVRTHPDFPRYRQEIRQMLKNEELHD